MSSTQVAAKCYPHSHRSLLSIRRCPRYGQPMACNSIVWLDAGRVWPRPRRRPIHSPHHTERQCFQCQDCLLVRQFNTVNFIYSVIVTWFYTYTSKWSERKTSLLWVTYQTFVWVFRWRLARRAFRCLWRSTALQTCWQKFVFVTGHSANRSNW